MLPSTVLTWQQWREKWVWTWLRHQGGTGRAQRPVKGQLDAFVRQGDKWTMSKSRAGEASGSPLRPSWLGMERQGERNQEECTKINLSPPRRDRQAYVLSPCSTNRGSQSPASRTDVSENWINDHVSAPGITGAVILQQDGRCHLWHFRTPTREKGNLGHSQTAHSILHVWIL